MRYSLVKIFAIAAASALSTNTASAATISATYIAMGSNFVSTAAPPYASVTESFTVTFDNTVTVTAQTTGISLNAGSTITPTSTLAFSYVAGADFLTVGGLADTVTTSDPASTDFAITIRNASNTADFSITAFSYTVGTGVTFNALTRTVGKPPTLVPEPASLALLGTVAVATVTFMRRRRTDC